MAIARTCMNPDCGLRGKQRKGNIRTHGWYRTKHGRRRRYICTACGKTFGSTFQTAYTRLKASRKEVDLACHMSAEGVDISSIARILNHAWNTIHRWIERARHACRAYLNTHLHGYELKEPQADEIKAFVGPRKRTTWIMAIIEVSTRLWPSIRVGKRSDKNIRILFGEAFHKGFSEGRVLITTDGFKPYRWVLNRLFGPACFYGQIVKTWKKNRVTKVDREIVIGEPWQIQHVLDLSEDSESLNTSFIERLNLTIRRNTSYLQRKTPAHAREEDALLAQLDLQRCFYNFMRPHMALKFGKETWTPAMMAGIAKRRITWRDVLGRVLFVWLSLVWAVKKAWATYEIRAQAAA